MRDLLPTLLARLLLQPTRGSIVIRIHAIADIPLVAAHAAFWVTLQVLILGALIQDTVVRESMNLFNPQRHWFDELLLSIGIGEHFDTLWKYRAK